MEIFWACLWSFAACAAFCSQFNIRGRTLLLASLGGALGWLVYLLSLKAGCSMVVSTFFASMVLATLSRAVAFRLRTPTTLFLLCGIFPLVPGAGIYYTAYYFLMEMQGPFLQKGVETLQLAVAVTLGIGVAYSIPARIFGWKSSPPVWDSGEHSGK